jgi:hypothetical protein
MRVSFEEFVCTIGFDTDLKPSSNCYQHETEDGLVFNFHREPGAPAPSPEDLEELEALARKLLAEPFEGMERDEEAGRMDRKF